MIQQEDKGNEFGIVKIHKNVIAQVASLAAKNVDGVDRIDSNMIMRTLDTFTRGIIRKEPIKIDLKENNEVSVTVPIVVNYGVNIPAVAISVQEKVKKAIEEMTGLYPTGIHVKIKGVEVKQ